MITNDLDIGLVSGPMCFLVLFQYSRNLKPRTLEAECITSAGTAVDVHSSAIRKAKCSGRVFFNPNKRLELGLGARYGKSNSWVILDSEFLRHQIPRGHICYTNLVELGPTTLPRGFYLATRMID